VRWINDSIATSPSRTVAGTDDFEQKLIVIAGGYDKHLSFAPLIDRCLTAARSLF
jgi:UDP-N-acetylmuramoylalanine--D-glutamate ligase